MEKEGLGNVFLKLGPHSFSGWSPPPDGDFFKELQNAGTAAAQIVANNDKQTTIMSLEFALTRGMITANELEAKKAALDKTTKLPHPSFDEIFRERPDLVDPLFQRAKEAARDGNWRNRHVALVTLAAATGGLAAGETRTRMLEEIRPIVADALKSEGPDQNVARDVNRILFGAQKEPALETPAKPEAVVSAENLKAGLH